MRALLSWSSFGKGPGGESAGVTEPSARELQNKGLRGQLEGGSEKGTAHMRREGKVNGTRTREVERDSERLKEKKEERDTEKDEAHRARGASEEPKGQANLICIIFFLAALILASVTKHA